MADVKSLTRTKKRMKDNTPVLGAIDIGGTKIASGLVSTSGRLLFRLIWKLQKLEE